MKNFKFILVVIIAILIITGCNNRAKSIESNNNKEENLIIYATFYPMYYIAREIAQEKADIVQMIPSGVEPHTWEPTLKTMAELKDSDIFIYNGVGMERWADKIIASLKENNVRVIEASQGLDLIKGEGNHGDDYDPHTWVSPINLKNQSVNVLKALIEIDEENKEYYNNNYENLMVKLDALDKDIRSSIETFNTKTIVTSHEAFGYFAKEYGLIQIPIRGISPENEPSPAKLAEIINLCKENNIKYIFAEKFINPKLSQLIADEIGGELLSLNAAHGLSEEEISKGLDYISIMYDNLKNLEKALK